jgi:acetoin utilization protein AcuC
VEAFAPEVLVTQCGCDTHHADPLADLNLTVDGQRATYRWLHRLAHEHAGGRWVACGGGGYGIVGCVPRAWTHLLAEVTGRPIDPATAIPVRWSDHARTLKASGPLPEVMGEGTAPRARGWRPGDQTALDRSIVATRRAVFPWLGLDADDPFE